MPGAARAARLAPRAARRPAELGVRSKASRLRQNAVRRASIIVSCALCGIIVVTHAPRGVSLGLAGPPVSSSCPAAGRPQAPARRRRLQSPRQPALCARRVRGGGRALLARDSRGAGGRDAALARLHSNRSAAWLAPPAAARRPRLAASPRRRPAARSARRRAALRRTRRRLGKGWFRLAGAARPTAAATPGPARRARRSPRRTRRSRARARAATADADVAAALAAVAAERAAGGAAAAPAGGAAARSRAGCARAGATFDKLYVGAPAAARRGVRCRARVRADEVVMSVPRARARHRRRARARCACARGRGGRRGGARAALGAEALRARRVRARGPRRRGLEVRGMLPELRHRGVRGTRGRTARPAPARARASLLLLLLYSESADLRACRGFARARNR